MTVLFNFRHFCSGAALAIATLAAVGACAKPSADIVDTTGPTVAGPITGGSKGWIYRSPVLDPEALGYVIEEYFVSGDAHSYRFAEGAEAQFDGAWSTEIDETAPFTTRIFVLRPSDPQDYNGVLLAHWQNVSAGYENGWPSGDEIFSGYAWMAVSAQYNGIYGTPASRPYSLVEWDAERYGSLEHPGDAFSYDIFAQSVSAALSASQDGAEGPLADLETDAVIAVGGSQSALRLASYINAAHQHDQLFDGFLLLAHFGIASPLNELSLPELFDAANGGANAYWTQINAPEDAPVLVIDTQAESLTHYAARQSDDESYRLWEIAGAPHTPPSTIGAKMLASERDGIDDEPPTGRNVVEWDYVKDAGIRYIARWAKTGEAPPAFERIAIDATSGRPQYVLDEFGNVEGGIRLPELEAVTGTHSAGWPQATLLGTSELFDVARMLDIHGSREAFLERWNATIDELLAVGLILPTQAVAESERALDYFPESAE